MQKFKQYSFSILITLMISLAAIMLSCDNYEDDFVLDEATVTQVQEVEPIDNSTAKNSSAGKTSGNTYQHGVPFRGTINTLVIDGNRFQFFRNDNPEELDHSTFGNKKWIWQINAERTKGIDLIGDAQRTWAQFTPDNSLPAGDYNIVVEDRNGNRDHFYVALNQGENSQINIEKIFHAPAVKLELTWLPYEIYGLTGPQDVTYQWLKQTDSIQGYVNIAGETTHRYNPYATNIPVDDGKYRLKVSAKEPTLDQGAAQTFFGEIVIEAGEVFSSYAPSELILTSGATITINGKIHGYNHQQEKKIAQSTSTPYALPVVGSPYTYNFVFITDASYDAGEHAGNGVDHTNGNGDPVGWLVTRTHITDTTTDTKFVYDSNYVSPWTYRPDWINDAEWDAGVDNVDGDGAHPGWITDRTHTDGTSEQKFIADGTYVSPWTYNRSWITDAEWNAGIDNIDGSGEHPGWVTDRTHTDGTFEQKFIEDGQYLWTYLPNWITTAEWIAGIDHHDGSGVHAGWPAERSHADGTIQYKFIADGQYIIPWTYFPNWINDAEWDAGVDNGDGDGLHLGWETTRTDPNGSTETKFIEDGTYVWTYLPSWINGSEWDAGIDNSDGDGAHPGWETTRSGVDGTSQQKFITDGQYVLKARVVGYIQTASLLKQDWPIEYCKITHLNIAFANPYRADATFGMDSFYQTETTAAEETVQLRDKMSLIRSENPNIEIYVSFAGGILHDGIHEIWEEYLGTSSGRTTIINNIIAFMTDNDFDGVDMDLEGAGIVPGYSEFIIGLKSAISSRSKTLTVAFPRWRSVNLSDEALRQFDFLNVMSYDETGPWTGPGQHSPYSNSLSGLNFWKAQGMPASKLNVGVPFYGYEWPASGVNTGFNYRSVVDLDPANADLDQVGAKYYNGRPTIRKKVQLAADAAGGIMIWELPGDSFSEYSLLSTIHEEYKRLGIKTTGLCED